MAHRYESRCEGCESIGIRCQGSGCPRRKVLVITCDNCGKEPCDDLYNMGGNEVCYNCLRTEHGLTCDNKSNGLFCGNPAEYEVDGMKLCEDCFDEIMQKERIKDYD